MTMNDRPVESPRLRWRRGGRDQRVGMIRNCEGVVMQAWRWLLCRCAYHHWVEGRCTVCRIDVWGAR